MYIFRYIVRCLDVHSGNEFLSVIITLSKNSCKPVLKKTIFVRRYNYGKNSSSVGEFSGSFWGINRSNCVPQFILSNKEDKSFLFKRSVNVRTFSLFSTVVLLAVSLDVISSLGLLGMFQNVLRKNTAVYKQSTHKKQIIQLSNSLTVSEKSNSVRIVLRPVAI